ncbi:Calcium-dependent lipid-binding (CaLB domain) family protein [Euphorbia peplus]|nr:Calcium-dependent lipid-binding (CaLB domain) family protein [Euphorbia peplus]
MESFNQTNGFRYDPSSNTMSDSNGDSEDQDIGILEIYVHHARNIHNICIYDNQDVYAKFSLTYNPDETHSTRIINGGGKNPEFNENLVIKLTQFDAVLKCEIWMLSRVRNYMEDQLLGFALVPISQILGKGKVTQIYSLSSTDLFHSPAGTVKLSLSLKNNTSLNAVKNPSVNSSISSEIVFLDRKGSEVLLDPIEYSRIEFPDINVVRENQQMVSEFFDSKPCSFLHLGASPRHGIDDYEMTMNDRNSNSGFLSSTTTSISDGNSNSSDSLVKKAHSSDSLNVSITTSTTEVNPGAVTAPDTPTSKKGGEIREHVSPLGNANLEAEQSAMQQQIVDMYMRSMQQFTESLAKMKLPMDLDKLESEDRGGDLIQSRGNKVVETEKKKKDGSRVFYGSRAFF